MATKVAVYRKTRYSVCMEDAGQGLKKGQTGTERAVAAQPGTQRKLRASERRDLELAQFCHRMAKESGRATSVQDRRDAKFWADMAWHIANTNEAGMPLGERTVKPTTKRLELIQRCQTFLDGVRDAEVAQLRSEGLSWDGIAQGVGMTREGARRRWGTP